MTVWLAPLSFALLGEERDTSHPEIERLYQLLLTVWQSKTNVSEPQTWFPGNLNCDWGSMANFFDGIDDDPFIIDEYRNQTFDWDRLSALLDTYDYDDPRAMLQVWIVIVATLMSDYQYLYF